MSFRDAALFFGEKLGGLAESWTRVLARLVTTEYEEHAENETKSSVLETIWSKTPRDGGYPSGLPKSWMVSFQWSTYQRRSREENSEASRAKKKHLFRAVESSRPTCEGETGLFVEVD